MPSGGTLIQDRSIIPTAIASEHATVTVADRDVLEVRSTAGRLTIHLVMPGIDRTVNITASPATAARSIDEASRRAGEPPSRAESRLRRAVSVLDGREDAWRSSADVSILALLGGAAYPMLAAAYDTGASPLGTIPPWATDILAEQTSRTACVRAFGDQTTRNVVAAFARSLVRADHAPVDLSRLALALIGRDVLAPDQLARVLEAPGDPWPPDIHPSPGRIADARTATHYWGAERTLGYLLQAAGGDAGRRRFDECVSYACDLAQHAPHRLPRELDALADCYRVQLLTPRHDPPARNRTTPPRVRRSVIDHDGREDVDYGLHFAPPTPSTVHTDARTAIPHPPWLTGVDQITVAGFSFVLPRTCGDLHRWGTQMRTCVDGFGPAAVSGRSHLIGVEEGGTLRYVIELTPERRIRQFSGPANRRPNRSDHDRIAGALTRFGAVVDTR